MIEVPVKHHIPKIGAFDHQQHSFKLIKNVQSSLYVKVINQYMRTLYVLQWDHTLSCMIET